jgi:hypothetical protein
MLKQLNISIVFYGHDNKEQENNNTFTSKK